MGMELIPIQMESNMKDNQKMINFMGKEFLLFLMELDTKVDLKMERCLEKVCAISQITQRLHVNGTKEDS